MRIWLLVRKERGVGSMGCDSVTLVLATLGDWSSTPHPAFASAEAAVDYKRRHKVDDRFDPWSFELLG